MLILVELLLSNLHLTFYLCNLPTVAEYLIEHDSSGENYECFDSTRLKTWEDSAPTTNKIKFQELQCHKGSHLSINLQATKERRIWAS